jgi:hypothetical protein
MGSALERHAAAAQVDHIDRIAHEGAMHSLGREGREIAAHDAKTFPYTAAMAAKIATPEARAAYRRRKAIVEAPNDWM